MLTTVEIKQVIVVRRDIKMSKGKLAVQVAHASVSALLEALNFHKEWVDVWLNQGQKKIVVRVDSLDELLEIYNKAKEAGLPTVLISDKGLTQLEPGTITSVGIGPAPSKKIDEITGKLKLL